MASRNSHNAAFVTGAVLGGLVGAAVALWKTPYSGQELRAKIAGDEPEGYVAVDTAVVGRLPEPTLKDRVISAAENLLAPVVGVELGKTANGSGPETPGVSTQLDPDSTMLHDAGTSASSGTSRTEPPAVLGYEGGGEQSPDPDKDTLADYGAARVGDEANVTPVDESAEVPDATSPESVEPASEPASVEDLTTPQTDVVPDALKHEHHEMQPFPDLGGKEKR